MNIQFLYFDGCPNIEAAYNRLEEVVSKLAPDATIEKIEVTSQDAAQKYKF